MTELKSEKIDDFIQNRKEFENPSSKQAFVLGVAVKRILDFKEGRPFFSKLGSLKLGCRKLQEIFIEAKNKAEEYSQSSKEGKELMKSVQPLFNKLVILEAKDANTNDENYDLSISYAFCCGLCYEEG